MDAKEFFNNQISTDANKCFVDVYSHKYDRVDLLRFAEAFHEAKLKEELNSFLRFYLHISESSIWKAVDEYLKQRNNGTKSK